MGSKAFVLIEGYKEVLKGAVVEIGADSPIFQEGSTPFFAHFCREQKLPFYSIDFDVQAYNRIKEVEGVRAFNMKGEDFLRNEFPTFGQKIAFAYLDNYDWIYDRHHSSPPVWMDRMRNGYEKYGYDLNNEKSQESHLLQAIEVERLKADVCVVIFDDTWQEEDGTFNGKGGAALPYLLSHGFELLERPRIGYGSSHDSYVIVGVGF